MLNKDKRSLILSFVLGDGCLHYHKNKGVLYGGLTIDHGMQQADYQSWKASFLSKIFNRNIKMRNGHKGQSVQLSVCFKKLRSWRRFTYPNNKKDITRILPFIRHPEFALAIWLMDDGYVEPSISKLATGEKKNYGARFRIFTNSQKLESVEYAVKWFQDNLKVTPMIKLHKDKGKDVYILKFTQKDSLFLWDTLREFILQFKSMQYKFRYVEQIYQLKCVQRTLDGNKNPLNDIVGINSNIE